MFFNILKIVGGMRVINKNKSLWIITSLLLSSFGHQSLSMEANDKNENETYTIALLKLRNENNEIKNNLSSASIKSIQSITSFNEIKKPMIFRVHYQESQELIDIGNIKFYLKNGKPDHIIKTNDPIIIEQQSPKSAFLADITINENYRGKGYGKSALTAFHDFLDRGEIDFTILVIDSKLKSAGKIYKKQGYIFTPNTLNAINNWAKNQEISPDIAEEKFLENTTQDLRVSEDTIEDLSTHSDRANEISKYLPTMVRYRPLYSS